MISILIQLNVSPEDITFNFLNGSNQPRTYKDNSLQYKLSFIVYILISGENSGKAVEDKVRHTCTQHISLLIKSRPQKINNTKTTRKTMTKKTQKNNDEK